MSKWVKYFSQKAITSNNRFEISDMHFKDKIAEIDFFDYEKKRILNTLCVVEKGGVIVDLGCCTGVILELIESQFEKCIGVDLSDEALQHARFVLPNCEFIHDDICNLQKVSQNIADYIISYGVLQYLSDDELIKFVLSVSKICKKGSKVLISRVPNQNFYNSYQEYRSSRNRIVNDTEDLKWNWISPEMINEITKNDFYFTPIFPSYDSKFPLKAFFDFVLIKK